jgi:hypothetical protein
MSAELFGRCPVFPLQQSSSAANAGVIAVKPESGGRRQGFPIRQVRKIGVLIAPMAVPARSALRDQAAA